MKKIIVITILTLLLCGCEKQEQEVKKTKVTCTEMKEIYSSNDNALLIDVRTADEYSENHLDNAINIEYQNIVSELKDTQKDTTIIVYCQSGKRSENAYKSLIDAGYTNVYDLGSINNCK